MAEVKVWTPSDTVSGYDFSLLDTPAPEYFTGEIILGSVCRALLLGVSEAEVDLANIATLPERLQGSSGVPREIWDRLLLTRVDGLASPQPKGRAARGSSLPQLAPLVPEVAAHGCVVGATRNRANPANLFFVTALRGLGATATQLLAREFASALSVGQADDIFARYVEAELARVPPSYRRGVGAGWVPSDLVRGYFDAAGDGPTASPVAARFCGDLRLTIALKDELTRRQWTVLLETVLRLGLGMQLLWTFRANEVVWNLVTPILGGGVVPSREEIELAVWGANLAEDPLLEAGLGAGPSIRSRLGRYARARVGINNLLVGLEMGGAGWRGPPLGIPPAGAAGGSAEAFREFLVHVQNNLASIKTSPVGEAGSIPSGWLSSSSGFNRNNAFFLLYGLGRLTPFQTEFQGYDQSFILSKKENPNAPEGRPDRSRWLVKLGPSALVALVHACCRSQTAFSATMDDFRAHLGLYGIRADGDELKTGLLGRELQRLGLVVDSPDAGGGRLLVDPIPGAP